MHHYHPDTGGAGPAFRPAGSAELTEFRRRLGVAGPYVVGWVLDHTQKDWHLTFLISTIIYFMGAICWIWIDPVTPLEKKAKA